MEDMTQSLRELSIAEYENSTVGDTERTQEFYGRSGRFIIERRRISYISTGSRESPISLRVHPAYLSFPEHSHDFIEMMYVYSGKIIHNIGGKSVTLTAGDIMILGRDATHSIDKTHDEDIGVNIIIAAETFEQMLSDIRRGSSLDISALFRMLDRTRDSYLFFHSADDPAVKNIVENIIGSGLLSRKDPYLLKGEVALLLSYLSSGDGNASSGISDTKAKRLIDYVKSSYTTASLGEAAELLGLSVSYLSRWCAEALGSSFKELVMKERFTAACELLSATEIPIGDIILNVGYENSSYFHKEFKKRYGMTPLQYRKTSEER